MSISGISSGMVDFASIQAQIKDRMAEKFNTSDVDGSGGLSFDEFKTASKENPIGQAASSSGLSKEEQFARLDADGSGEITTQEIREQFESRSSTGLADSMLPQLLSLQESSGGSFAMAGSTDSLQSSLLQSLMEMTGSTGDDDK